uniref:Immunoglobulin V-set domain-containing protein n=1 Tax=Seriola dumerili TaxID=41447 RepID=A0A3B4TEJ6_SERDU
LFISCLLLFAVALSCVSGAAPVIHVSGYEGRDVNVSCPYEARYQTDEKYFCRNDCGNSDVLIGTPQANKNKYSISDNKNKQVLTTTISDLSSVDAGKYWCGVTIFGLDHYPAEVRLDVVPASSLGLTQCNLFNVWPEAMKGSTIMVLHHTLIAFALIFTLQLLHFPSA